MRKLVFIPFFLILITSLKGQDEDFFIGTWRIKPLVEDNKDGSFAFRKMLRNSINVNELTITKIGKYDVNYFVESNGKTVAFKRKKNILYHLPGKDTSFIKLYNNSKLYLSGIIGHQDSTTFERVNGIKEHTHTNSKLKNTFFDYDLEKYNSGIFEYFLPLEPLFPFGINRKFIVKHNIDSIYIPVYFSYNDTTDLRLSHISQLYFNEFGGIDRCMNSRSKDIWDLHYRNDNHRSIEEISYHSSRNESKPKKYYFDRDNWRVDEQGQKKIISKKNWILNQQGAPSSLHLDNMSNSNTKFVYDSSNKLIQANYYYSENRIRKVYYFFYSSEIINKVIVVNK